MPYFYEEYANSHKITSNASGRPFVEVLDSTKLTTHRAYKRGGDFVSSKEEIDPAKVDPYAYFLTSKARKDYANRLSERGISAKGVPDRGHPFQLVKHTNAGLLNDITDSSFDQTEYDINVIPSSLGSVATLNHVHLGELGRVVPLQEPPLASFAQLAYNRSAPSTVVFDAAQFLGELRQGLPRMLGLSLMKDRASAFSKAGSEYLNVQFGWLPFLADIQAAASALGKAHAALSIQGETSHRQYELPDTLETGTWSGNYSYISRTRGFRGVLGSDAMSEFGFPIASGGGETQAFGSVTTFKRKHVRTWFEGMFSNFLPVTYDADDYISRLSVLMDVNLTPRVLWELAPWSWMIDWFLKIQDTIEANEKASNDHLIMHYGYAMRETVYETAYLMRPGSGRWVYKPAAMRSVTTYKERIRANPWGFHVNTLGAPLTGARMSILASLALTKGR